MDYVLVPSPSLILFSVIRFHASGKYLRLAVVYVSRRKRKINSSKKLLFWVQETPRKLLLRLPEPHFHPPLRNPSHPFVYVEKIVKEVISSHQLIAY